MSFFHFFVFPGIIVSKKPPEKDNCEADVVLRMFLYISDLCNGTELTRTNSERPPTDPESKLSADSVVESVQRSTFRSDCFDRLAYQNLKF